MPSVGKCNKKGGSPLSFSRYLTSKTSILHHFRPDVIMAFYGKRTFLGLPSCIKSFVLQNRVTIFFQKLTQYGLMIEVYIKAKKWVCHRLIFRATVHKMPDLLYLKTELLTLRMTTLTLLNFSRHVSAIASCRLPA